LSVYKEGNQVVKIISEFLEFEKEYDLFSLKYKGVNYWYLIRNALIKDVLFGVDRDNSFHPDFLVSTKNERRKYLKHILGQVKHFFDSNKYDIFVSSANIERMIHDRLANPHTYFLEEYNFSLKHNTLFTDRWPRNVPKGSNSALMRALLFIYTKYQKLLWKFKKNEKDSLCHCLKMFRKTFKCNIKIDKYIETTEALVCSFKLMKWYYSWIINNKYRAIFLSDSHCIEHYSLIAAASECKIPTIEYQHGVIGLGVVKYNFLSNSKKGIYFPDYLFTYGEFWNSACSLPKHAQAISVGSPLFDESKEKYNGNLLGDKNVVYISTGFIGEELSKHAINFAKLTEGLGYRVIYKLHPSECLTWRERYPWLVNAINENGNIECVHQSTNIYEILSKAKHVVSVASTVIFEALSFGCNVYIWNKAEYEKHFRNYYNEITKRGYVDLFESELELLCHIQSKGTNDSLDIDDIFYKHHSVDNIRLELTRIMNK